MAKAPQPTFEVRFVSRDITPEQVPLRAVSDALAAVQDLASGRDSFETQQVPKEKSIGLLKIRRGSAVYGCVAHDPDDAIANLRRVSDFLLADASDAISDQLIAALHPVEALSLVAKSLQCRVDVCLTGAREAMFSIERDVYERLASRVFLTGDTTVIGTIERAGGATEMKCLLRVPDRRKLLYCDVEGKQLVQRLGQHLYEQIAAIGTATWIHSAWRIHKFKIRDFTQPRVGAVAEAISEFRKAGLSAWDSIDDPEAYVGELRT